VAVTKGVPVERLVDALAVGLTDLGENRVQEAEPKIAALAGARWHMVGRLQSNKAARAVEIFDVVQSVASLALAERLARLAAERGRGPLPVYLQVNVDRDPAKSGFTADQLAEQLPLLVALEQLDVRGLMTIGQAAERPEDARSTFAGLRELGRRLRAVDARLGGGLSMGMTDDFELAVEEGATIVRIGRALFGERPTG
jgi:PLP dependent protein